MALTDYPHLIEIQSLYKEISKERASIDDQLSRLSKLEQRKNEKLIFIEKSASQLSNLKKENLEIEHTIFDIDKKLNNIEKNKAMIKNENEVKSYQKQNISLNQEKEKLESSYFEKLEELEGLEVSINDSKTFITGVEKSIFEVENEVTLFQKEKNTIINNLKDRINKIKDQCTPSFIKEFEFVLKKHPTKQLSLMKKNGECSTCGFIIDVSDRTQIEKGLIAQTCASCGRLLFVN